MWSSRLIKRVLYTGIGAGIGASVCYPEEANEAMATVEKEGKKAVEMVQALANGGEQEASADLCLCATITKSVTILLDFLCTFLRFCLTGR